MWDLKIDIKCGKKSQKVVLFTQQIIIIKIIEIIIIEILRPDRSDLWSSDRAKLKPLTLITLDWCLVSIFLNSFDT